MRHPIIIGLQYGDEGKGKITDILAEHAKWVIRFNGGNNAGHTIWIGGKKLVTHSVPSGVMYPGARNYIGPGCVVDPQSLRKEIEEISQAKGSPLGPEHLSVDYRAHLTLPVHIALDAMREKTANSIGTTKRGIGPTYVAKMDRYGVRAGDLGSSGIEDKVKALCDAYAPLLAAHKLPASTHEDNMAAVREAEWLQAYVTREEAPFYDVARNERCLLEGAQGALLDVDHGSYPFVTSSNTMSGSAASGAPFPLSRLGGVIGIAKAYVTRVGQGELATELNDATGERIRKNGGEFGATTGRPRRVGWLDLDELRTAVRLSDTRWIVLSKADVLSGEKEVFCRYQGKLVRFEGWANVVNGTSLDKNFEKYVEFIERAVGVAVTAVGTGADRSHLFWRKSQPDFWAD